jgi:hypothetical protein
MGKQFFYGFSLLISASIVFLSCKKTDTPADPCAGVSYNIEFNKSESVGSSNNGAITITYPLGDTIQYSLNSGSFQASRFFTNLPPGSYIINVKNQKGCLDTSSTTILNYGPKYALVKQLITGYCGPCHLGVSMEGGMNFETDANIVANKARIKVRAVDGIPSFMPQGGQLTTIDKQKITDWINAGGTTSN